MMEVYLSKQSIKFLDAQDDKTALRIVSAINKLPSGDTKKLKGYVNQTYRLSIGSFRVIYTLENDMIFIKKINNRGQVYK